MEPRTVQFDLLSLCVSLSSGYDVQSASTPDGILYITGAPRYNHTGRVTIYRFDGQNITVTQTLKGQQVGHITSHTP